MADNWGKKVDEWVGRRVELYGDPNVYFGKEKRGGTRISRLSHIPKSKTTLINPRGGKSAYWTVEPLPDAPAAPTEADVNASTDLTQLRAWYVAHPALQDAIKARAAVIDDGEATS